LQIKLSEVQPGISAAADLFLSGLLFAAASSPLHQSGDCPQRFVYVVSSSKLASDIRRQDDNVSTGRVAGRMLSAHTFTEIVLRTHLIGSTGLSLTLLLHIVFAHCGSRIAQ
jgi:hypothetical protein